MESMRNLNDAGFVLAQSLISDESKDCNLVFSPISIHVALSLLTAGADGATKDQLLSFLKAESPSHLHSFYSDLVAPALADGTHSGGPALSFANGLWIDKSFSLKPSFKQLVDTFYKAHTKQVDFQYQAGEAIGEVNSWVEEKTKGLIKEVVSVNSVNRLTRLICANALYFKGAWTKEFDSHATREYDFYLLDGSLKRVFFITNWEEQAVAAHDGFKVLRLPYRQGTDKREFSMYLILPDATDGLPALVEQVCSQSGFLDCHVPKKRVRLDEFRIPKFKICFQFKAKKVLERLGLVLPFEPNGGGLKEMVESEKRVVTNIHHKAFIEVDETGTIAAAVTEDEDDMGCCLDLEPPVVPDISFVADHPFMYVVREDLSGIVLFIGQVLDPLETC